MYTHTHTRTHTHTQIHRYYRRSGGSLNKAMEEGVSGAAKNQYVRGAVKSGVSAGVKTAFTE